jgi:ABC-type sugar transport system ATPase subunit
VAIIMEEEAQAMLEVRRLSVRAGAFGLFDVSLKVPAGSYGVLMGRTGSGKTTLMEAVCGLKKVTAGAVLLAGEDVTKWRPGERGIGLVPQDTVLFNHMTVHRHFAFGPQLQGWDRDRIEARVEELAAALGVAHLLKRKPHGLSGGEGKRVALGRALAAKPRVLCLDEPFSALDEETHGEICDLLKELQRSQGFTTLHITHGRAEAERLADVRFRLVDGRVTQE